MSDFLPVSQLDFTSLRENLKTYLQGQDRFKDYDFEGSNLSVLLDILAFNTYQNAFYLNMIGNEMFLDTATLRDSVVSHAKELNYVPRSYTSAAATVRVNVAVTNNAIFNVTVPQGYKFTSTSAQRNFTFSTTEPAVITRNSNNQFVKDVIVYEGFLLSEKYVVNNSIENQRFVISNPKVDTDSIEVFVSSDINSNVFTEYTLTTSIFGLSSNSTVYFLQAAENEKYEVLFGDNIISKKPTNGNLIRIDYRVSSGSDSNGLNTFSPQSTIEGYSVTSSTIAAASGGSNSESISSIKFNSTKFFQTQDRVVTKEDYKSLIIANFPEIKTISVYGGEEIPGTPQYGRVVISPVTQTGTPITQTTADRVLSFVKTRSPLSINPVLVDPDFLDLQVNTTVKYNINQTTLSANQIRSLVSTAISDYNSANLIDFNKTFRYSKFVSAINNAHPSIVSNETSILVSKTINPLLNENYSETINFGNELRRDDYNVSRPLTNEFTVYSSQITYNSRPAYFGEDGAGGLFVYELTGAGRSILKNNAGTVDYINGTVNINNIIISDFVGPGIVFYAIPAKQDIRSLRNTVLQIDNLQTVIAVEAVKE
jgi:hypothetical protein